MVGTPSNTVTRSRSITCSAAAGLNLGISVRQAPDTTAAFSPQVCPKLWNSGRQPITTSSGPRSSSVVAVTEAFFRMLACVSSAPFGVPVVPEVYRITAVSSSARGATSGAGVQVATSSSVAALMVTAEAPAFSAPAAASSAKVSQASTRLAPESPR